MRKLFSTFLVTVIISSGFVIHANAVDTRTCAQGGPCAVGDVGPGGGVVFYVRTPGAFTDSFTAQRGIRCPGTFMMCRDYTVQVDVDANAVDALTFDYLEFAPVSGLTNMMQASSDGSPVTSSAFGSGQANTSAFLAYFPGDDGTNNATHWANNFVANNQVDWFLPSTDELGLLMIRHLKGELGSSSPLSGPYYQAWSSENQTQFMSSQSSLNKQFGRNSTVQGFVIPIRAFSSTAAPTPTPTPTPKPTSVAEVKKTSASSKIVFNRSSSILTKSSKAKLKKLAKTVGAGSKITVTASVGPLNGATKAQMTALAKLRAEAISKYLKSIIGINHTFKVNIIDSGVKPVTTVKAN